MRSPFARRLSLITLALTVAPPVAAVAVGAGAVSASDGCTTRSTSTAFSQWGDDNSYFLVTSGSFESGSSGWSSTGSVSVVNDQEPWRVNGSNHQRALRIAAGASATSTKMCVASDEQWLRLFYRDPGVNGAGLQVKVVVTNGRGDRAENTYTIGSSRAGWAVVPQIFLPDIRDANGQQYTQITFTPVNTQATWVIDDVMIDPWVSR